jgi:hypothetical protein
MITYQKFGLAALILALLAAPSFVYIARPCGGYRGSPFGNPFRLRRDASTAKRAERIVRYRAWLMERPACWPDCPS